MFTTNHKKQKNTTLNSASSKNNKIENKVRFLDWIQEFSKKVVVITFFIFIAANVFYLWIILSQFVETKEISFLDTFISEMHLTFREVIGGYIIKAAVENAIKIGGNYIANYMNTKSKIEREKLYCRYGIKKEDLEEFTDNFEEETDESEE